MISERAFVRSFGSFWNELLPLLTPRFVAIFNVEYAKSLRDSQGNPLRSLPVANGIHPDLVAEFAFRLARLTQERDITILPNENMNALIEQAEYQAFNLISLYEGTQHTRPKSLSEVELNEGILLGRRYGALYQAFGDDLKVAYCPSIPGAGFLASTEADISINDTLIEVKTTTRPPSGQDIKQLIVYLALDASAHRNQWARVGIFNPRRGMLHCVETDALLFQLSGGRLRPDVLADLLAFVQSHEPHIENKF